jgi:hypothetical protein
MSDNANPATTERDTAPLQEDGKSQKSSLFKLPGLIAICLYVLLLSGVTVVSVVQGRAGMVYLVFSILFIAGALGLLLLQRWGWALTLAAVAILSGSFLWEFSLQHQYSFLVKGVLNLFFFLYLVREDVRSKLK